MSSFTATLLVFLLSLLLVGCLILLGHAIYEIVKLVA